jgi:hypothetical protein
LVGRLVVWYSGTGGNLVVPRLIRWPRSTPRCTVSVILQSSTVATNGGIVCAVNQLRVRKTSHTLLLCLGSPGGEISCSDAEVALFADDLRDATDADE